MPESQQIQKMFSGIARSYDLMNHLLSFGLDRYWWRQMAKESGATQGKWVLDVAAGTGDSSIALAKLGAKVVSSDFTLEMLALGPGKFKRKGLAISSAGADAQALPFKDGSFDGLTVCYGIRNVESRQKALKEFLRVLKPDGQLTILEFSQPKGRLFRKAYDLYSSVVLPRLGGWIARDAGAYTYLRESIQGFPCQAEFAKELEESGFFHVTWKNLTGGIAAIHTGKKAS